MLAWAKTAEDDRWANVTTAVDSADEGFQPDWEDDNTDWAAVYGVGLFNNWREDDDELVGF